MEEAKKVATAKAAEDTVRYKDALGARVSQHEHTTHHKVQLEGEVVLPTGNSSLYIRGLEPRRTTHLTPPLTYDRNQVLLY
jgi:hypothetical protein